MCLQPQTQERSEKEGDTQQPACRMRCTLFHVLTRIQVPVLNNTLAVQDPRAGFLADERCVSVCSSRVMLYQVASSSIVFSNKRVCSVEDMTNNLPYDAMYGGELTIVESTPLHLLRK